MSSRCAVGSLAVVPWFLLEPGRVATTGRSGCVARASGGCCRLPGSPETGGGRTIQAVDGVTALPGLSDRQEGLCQPATEREGFRHPLLDGEQVRQALDGRVEVGGEPTCRGDVVDP